MGGKTAITLSKSEKEYIVQGVKADLRNDGRSCLDWRPLSTELYPVPQAAGSSRVLLGGTDVLVSIKGDIGRPTLEHPDEGIIVCFVDSSAVTSMNTISGANEERQTAERNAELTAILNDILVGSGAIDKRKLCLMSGRHCWVLYIDVLVLDYAGNLVDAMVMASRLALLSMRLPKVRIEEGGEATEIVLAEEYDDERILSVSELPVTITVGIIGEGFIIDPSGAEESCCDSALLVSLLPSSGQVVAMRKLGGGMVDPGLVFDYINTACRSANQLISMAQT